MTKLNCLLVSIIVFGNLSAQIKNPGFEIISDSVSGFPASWSYQKVNGYFVTSDSLLKFSGNRSVRISNNEGQINQANFYQTIPFKTEKIRKLCISVYIKTENVERGAWLSAKMINPANGKTIGSATTKFIAGSANWEKHKIILIADRDADIKISGVLRNKGTAWFDDITMEEIQSNDSTPPTEEVVKFISEFLDTVQTHSLFTDSINWRVLRDNISKLSMGINSIEEAHTILNYVIDKLRWAGDNHSSVSFPSFSVTEASQMKNLITVPKGKYLGNHIGYVSVPDFNSANDTASRIFADMLQQIIKRIDQKHTINNWIVDLRDDRGGSMFPMIAGLVSMLGYDTLGYFVNKKEREPWFISKGDWMPPYFLKNRQPKIAVLIGPATASSGEATAISFIGKTNTKLFGQTSGGYTSANDTYKLKDGSYLTLAISIEADRKMKLYPSGITPDVIVKDDVDKNVDACLETAKKWILEIQK